MAFWGIECKPKKALPLAIERRLVVKQAALVIEKSNPEPCVLSVSVGSSNQQYVVCRLHEGKLEHCTLELPFSPSDNATLHLKGPHTIHLTGFLDMEDEDEFDEDADVAIRGGGAMDEDDDDEDEDDDDDFDGVDDFDEDDDDEDDDEEEEDDDEDEDDDDEVVIPSSKKRAAPAAPPPAKKAKAAAAAPPPKPAAADPAPGANLWTKEEEAKFAKAMKQYPEGSDGRWEKVAAAVGTRSKQQCKKKAKA